MRSTRSKIRAIAFLRSAQSQDFLFTLSCFVSFPVSVGFRIDPSPCGTRPMDCETRSFRPLEPKGDSKPIPPKDRYLEKKGFDARNRDLWSDRSYVPKPGGFGFDEDTLFFLEKKKDTRLEGFKSMKTLERTESIPFLGSTKEEANKAWKRTCRMSVLRVIFDRAEIDVVASLQSEGRSIGLVRPHVVVTISFDGLANHALGIGFENQRTLDRSISDDPFQRYRSIVPRSVGTMSIHLPRRSRDSHPKDIWIKGRTSRFHSSTNPSEMTSPTSILNGARNKTGMERNQSTRPCSIPSPTEQGNHDVPSEIRSRYDPRRYRSRCRCDPPPPDFGLGGGRGSSWERERGGNGEKYEKD